MNIDTKNARAILPDMDDYYYDCVDIRKFVNADKGLRPKNVTASNPGAAKFYLEEPPELGYNDQYKISCVKYYKSNDGISNYDGQVMDGIKIADGDTVYFNVENMEYGDEQTREYVKNVSNKAMSDFAGVTKNDKFSTSAGCLAIRFACINTGELPHFEPMGSESQYSDCAKEEYEFKSVPSGYRKSKYYSFMDSEKIGQEVSIDENVYDKKINDDDKIKFIKFNDTYNQYFVKDGRIYMLYTNDVSVPSSIKDAGVARDRVCDVIHKSSEIRIVMNMTTLSRSAMVYADKYKTGLSQDAVSQFLRIWESFTGDNAPFMATGFNMLGEDAFGRVIGVIYCKVNDQWINLNKLVLAYTCETTKVNEAGNHTADGTVNNNYLSDMINPEKYEYNEKVYAEMLYASTALLDDRDVVHGKLHGNLLSTDGSINEDATNSFEALKEWTVTIGDCMFFVPPTSIRKISQSKATYIQPLRARGKLFKSPHKAQHILEMDLYFNEDRGINGAEYEAKLPNGEKITYYLDGLRSLMAQFRTCPFLPIDNNYINQQLHIMAVSLVSLNIDTVPNYPKLYKATLQMSQFDYRIYMPEIPMDEDDTFGERNYFAKQIYYPLMRYYYQRLIRNGEAVSNLEFNSDEYNKNTFGNHTCLQPMKFQDSSIRFYVPNKEDLDIKKQYKISRLQRSVSTIKLTPNDLMIAKDINKVYEALTNTYNNSAIKSFHMDEEMTVFKDGIRAILYDRNKDKDSNEFCLQICELSPGDKDGKDKKYQIVPQSTYDFETNVIMKFISDERDALSKLTSESGDPLCDSIDDIYQYSVSDDGSTVTAKIIVRAHVKLDYAGREESLNKLKAEATKSKNGDGESIDQVFVDNYINHTLTLTLKCINVQNQIYIGSFEDNSFKVDTSSTDAKFLVLCNELASKTSNGDASDTDEIKATLDWENYNSIKFDQYNLGTNLHVQSFSATMTNSFAQVTLQQTDGYAPQFMGGSELEIRTSIFTTDKGEVGLLDMLPGLSADYAREYHSILATWPLKVDSEFTRFLGVNEVIIDTLVINTVPNYPGLYQIDIVMYSTDRSLRNRESLKGKDLQNFKNLSEAGKNAMRSWEYDQINEMLSETELYPDLELPTIKELNDIGYSFLRYTNDKRVYPDPDFYFTYAHTLTSQIIREAVLNGLSELDDKQGFKITSKDVDYESNLNNGVDDILAHDSYVNKIKEAKEDLQRGTITQEQADLIITEYEGKIARFNQPKSESVDKLVTTTNMQHKDAENISDFLINEENSINQVWDVSSKIKVVLCEKTAANNISDTMKLAEKKSSEEAEDSSDEKKADSDKKETDSADAKKTEDSSETSKTDNFIYNEWNKVVGTMVQKINEYLTTPIEDYDESFVETTCSVSDERLEYFKNQWGNYTSLSASSNGFSNTCTSVYDKLAYIMEGTGYGVSSDLTSTDFGKMLYSAACAVSGDQEYAISADDKRYTPNPTSISYSDDTGKLHNTLDYREIKDIPVEQINMFGPFFMKVYNVSQIELLLRENVDEVSEDENINIKKYLLDPYYRACSDEERKYYIVKCCTDVNFATMAFFRIALLWIKKMADWNITPSFEFDLFRYQITNMQKLRQILTTLRVENGNNLANTYQEYFKRNSTALDNGRLFLGICCAMSEGNTYFLNLLKNRDYNALMSMTRSCLVDVPSIKEQAVFNVKYRKLIRSLIATKLIEEADIGSANKGNNDTPSVSMQKTLMDDMTTAASNDPKVYVKHSFYDMITLDCRGRMLRAFPTFYMVFIDEGRKIGMWKLHDNFYTSSCISEINITKSRKIAADTAQITMSNFFNTYTANDDDVNQNYVANYYDVFRSIFTPKVYEYATEQENKRSELNSVERVRLQAGIRIQIRIGYGSDASVLPINFNGMITDLDINDTVVFTAQGDGHELSKPLPYDKEASEVEADNSFITLCGNGTTPYGILRNILNSYGTPINAQIKGTKYEDIGDYFGTPMNPYFIYHFGESTFKDIGQFGEQTQNIFEAGMCRPPSKQSKRNISARDQWYSDDKLEINFQMAGKTVWEIMQICKSAVPGYIASIVPFSFRSSIFFGRPNDYYAYQYINVDGTWYEKRKPFQQYHIYTSENDIVGNYVSASAKSFKSCCVGIYEVQGSFNSKSVEHTQPIWMDKEIYPEYQNTFYYDTKYYGKGSRKFGVASSAFDWLFADITNKTFDRSCDMTGSVKNHHAVATRMATNALKYSAYDMYQGPLIIVGDPSVKPYDRIYIMDTYNDITGNALVRDVVQSISYQNGYTTSIYPDLIATTYEDKEAEIKTQNALASAGTLVASIFCTTRAIRMFGKRWTKYALNLLQSAGKKASDAKQVIKNLSETSKLVSQCGSQAKKLLPILKHGGKIANILSILARGAAAIGTSSVGGLAGSAVAGVGTLAGIGASLLGGFVVIIIGCALWAGIGCMLDWVTQSFINSRALTLFPLMKYGKPMVAGIDGNMSLVYGSLSYNKGEEGIERDMIKKISEAVEPDSVIANALDFFYGTSGVIDAARQYDHEILKEQVTDETIAQTMMNQAVGSPLTLFSRTAINPVLPRVDITNTTERDRVVKAIGVKSNTIDAINKDRNMYPMQLITEYGGLKKYIDNGFFVVAHETNDYNNGTSSKISKETISIGGAMQKSVNVMKEEKDGNTTIDLPMLNGQALFVLAEIIKRSFELTVGTENTRDENEKYKTMKGEHIVFESGLKAGSKVNYESTGYSFVLEVTGSNALTAIKKAMNEINERFKKASEKNSSMCSYLFAASVKEKKVFIVVRMPIQ